MDSTEQIIRGFGAANIVNWRPDMTEAEINTAFSIEEGNLGFSILRLRIPPNQNEWPDYVPTAQAAHQMGVTIVASPWTPPAEMKTNNSTVRGRLREDAYDDFADFLNEYINYMAENGVPIYAVSIQNEPDVEVTYESCDWNGQEMVKFLRENAPSINTKVMAPESFQFRRELSDPILEDSLATANMDILSGHIYGGGLAPYPLAEEKGKEIWMTEHLDTDISWEANLATGKEIHDVISAGMNAYIWWYIVRFYGPIHDGEDWNGDDIVDNTAKSEITKRGYIMSHYSRFIRPGYVKIGATENPRDNIFITAYRDTSNVDTAKTIIVALNTDSSPTEQNFVLDSGSAISFRQYFTDKNVNVEQLTDINATSGSFTVTLGAESITTFISDTATVTSIEESENPGSYKLRQNYPNPFNPATTISFELPQASVVSLKIFDMLGREVSTLLSETMPSGAHEINFDASSLSSGIYIYRLKAGDFIQTKQMTLIK